MSNIGIFRLPAKMNLLILPRWPRNYPSVPDFKKKISASFIALLYFTFSFGGFAAGGRFRNDVFSP